MLDLPDDASFEELTCVVSLFESSAYELLASNDIPPILDTVITPAIRDATNLL